MSARSFNEIKRPYGDRGWRAVATISCAKCGEQGETPIGTGASLLPDNVIAKKFAAIGWLVGNSPKHDECPKCITEKKVKPVLKVVSPSESPPRQMGRDDRRIIFEKLNETYVDEKTGYDSGWSDHRVATDLGVPRKWVETVREEMFGSIGTNAEMSQFLLEADALVKEARECLDEARKHREAIEAIAANAKVSSTQSIADKISRLDRLANEVRKLVVTP